ncbi:TPM domain-containing protein [Cryobacterium algoricola]|uniref:TPM domain-containing protein n=1 Tax=Cryobacterium algoricola TaxID=1259183 RepID=A0ABY2IE90_9MICO|nr:TPM domain-containing protein [Cryobacterium algoricola]TFB85923.1 TPM domain-containing protein [Cryobacterium algoricola]
MRSRRMLFRGTGLAALVVVGLCFVGLCFGAGPGTPAYAEDPPSFGSSHVVDTVGALGSRTDEVTAALDRLYVETRTDLFVAYVGSFSGVADRQQWADQTADDNGLGTNDVLLAVATGDRQYQLSVAQNSALTDAQLLEVETVAIEPALRVNDWAGAAIGAANGFAATIGGQPVPAPSLTPGAANPGGGDSSGGGVLIVVLVALVVFLAIVVGTIVVFARRGRRGAVTAPGAGPPAGSGLPAGAAPPTGAAALSTEELSRRAATALVQTDDAVTSSEQELGFALAQYGQVATEAFRTALDSAKAELRAAFTLQQKLDDAVPDTEEQRRDWFVAILDGCERANATLDDQAADFAALRQLEKNAPAAAASATSAADATESRIAPAATRLAELAGRYTAAALGTVADNADQARERIVFARTALSEAGKRIESDPPGAAVGIRAAEESVDQAGLLLDAVDRLGTDLSTAADRVTATLTELQGDLAAAHALPATPPGIIADTERVVADVSARLGAGPINPLELLGRLEAANGRMDAALQGVRDAAAQAQRTEAALDQALLSAHGQVSAAEDFITARRGAVGAEARTRLAEAGRLLAQADSARATDPGSALAAAQRSGSLAAEAITLARADVDGFAGAPGPGTGLGGGQSAGNGSGMLGAVLGGILINSVLTGRPGGGLFGGGSFGGGGPFGGSRGRGGGGGFGLPGGFGGAGTRSHRGGGGRF